MTRAWLPEELKPYQVGRLALGVVPSRPKDDPENPDHYQGLYREKVLRAIRKSLEAGEDPVDVLDTLLLAGPRVALEFAAFVLTRVHSCWTDPNEDEASEATSSHWSLGRRNI